MESEVASWLTLRAGIQKAIVSRGYDSEDAVNETYFDNSRDDVKFSTGFGINWQNFTLDADVNVESLEEDSLADVEPGRGIFFGGDLVEVSTADLRYKF